MVRHRECYEQSAQKSRRAGNGLTRYSLLGLAEDILDVVALAERGGAGPVGPAFERLYWSDSGWTPEKPNAESSESSGS